MLTTKGRWRTFDRAEDFWTRGVTTALNDTGPLGAAIRDGLGADIESRVKAALPLGWTYTAERRDNVWKGEGHDFSLQVFSPDGPRFIIVLGVGYGLELKLRPLVRPEPTLIQRMLGHRPISQGDAVQIERMIRDLQAVLETLIEAQVGPSPST